MTSARLTPWLIGTTLVVLTGAVVGWAVGSGVAKQKNDARVARDQGYEEGFRLAFGQSRKVTVTRGLRDGAVRGRRAGTKTGAREGSMIGAGNSQIETAVGSQKSAEVSESSADSEIAARSANCGMVPAAPGWCPTSSELSAYEAAVEAAREAAEKEEAQKKKREEARNERP